MRKKINLQKYFESDTFIAVNNSGYRRTPEMSLSVCAQLLPPCPTLCDPTDRSPPGFSVHGILHARILEWVSTPSSNVSVKIHHPSNIGWSRQCFVVQQECAFGGAFLNPILYIFPLIWADFMLLILLYVFITNVPDTLKRKDPVKANRTPGCRVALH